MTYEDIWQKIKRMSQRDRKMLAYELRLFINTSREGMKEIGYIHPHYYFDAKAVHDILFYPPHSQNEIEDKDDKYYHALKSIIEDDNEIHVCIKRYPWLPRFVNNMIESKIVMNYICSRINNNVNAAKYKIWVYMNFSG